MVNNVAEQKFEVQRNRETGHFSGPAWMWRPLLVVTGEASDKMTIGEVGTPICTLNLSLHYRTKLALSTYSSADPIVMKSDHFKLEQSPRVRRVTGFTERRPRSVRSAPGWVAGQGRSGQPPGEWQVRDVRSAPGWTAAQIGQVSSCVSEQVRNVTEPGRSGHSAQRCGDRNAGRRLCVLVNPLQRGSFFVCAKQLKICRCSQAQKPLLVVFQFDL